MVKELNVIGGDVVHPYIFPRTTTITTSVNIAERETEMWLTSVGTRIKSRKK